MLLTFPQPLQARIEAVTLGGMKRTCRVPKGDHVKLLSAEIYVDHQNRSQRLIRSSTMSHLSVDLLRQQRKSPSRSSGQHPLSTSRMDRLPLKREDFFLDENNPDHTGWRYPGLQHAIKSHFTAEVNDLRGVKRVFYTMQKLHFFPCRHLRRLGGGNSPSVIRPAQLHRDEGPGANIFAFVSWITFVKHRKREWWRMINHLHVYTAGSDLEIPRDATLADILSGKYGKMDQEHPLRVVWIPGKRGGFDQ